MRGRPSGALGETSCVASRPWNSASLIGRRFMFTIAQPGIHDFARPQSLKPHLCGLFLMYCSIPDLPLNRIMISSTALNSSWGSMLSNEDRLFSHGLSLCNLSFFFFFWSFSVTSMLSMKWMVDDSFSNLWLGIKSTTRSQRVSSAQNALTAYACIKPIRRYKPMNRPISALEVSIDFGLSRDLSALPLPP